MPDHEQVISALYRDRNQIAQLAASLAARLGLSAGIGIDAAEPDWPVVYIELGIGNQVSWHVPPHEVIAGLPSYPRGWDTHTDEEKRTRIAAFVRATRQQGGTMTTESTPRARMPSIGRIVHYVAYGTPKGEYTQGAHRAAIVTQVFDQTRVGLCVFNPTGNHWIEHCLMVEPAEGAPAPPGTWHWPEFVPDGVTDEHRIHTQWPTDEKA